MTLSVNANQRAVIHLTILTGLGGQEKNGDIEIGTSGI
jgi:hypothetical protein